MIPEIGLLFLIMACVLSLVLPVISALGAKKDNLYLLSYAKPLMLLVFSTLLFATLILGYCFIVDDFSVAYVANNSNSQLIPFYKIAAVWGSHEGSMLFWVVAIAGWGAAIIMKAPNTKQHYHAKLIAVLGLIIFGFCLFLLFTSSPFTRLLPDIPIEGRDLNPVLQDIGLVIHPPLLFLGYVGLAVCFAGAVAALLCGGLSIQYARYMQPWAICAWVFLTGGNAFGSWWAYNELGWGGWWFWDPVENASFIPWLVATAMLHSIVLTARQGLFASLSIFLAILAFSLSLLGSFLVRSGVVQSVHAFATDPTRGIAILVLLVIFSGAALALFAQRTRLPNGPLTFTLISKESLLLLGNLLLVIAAVSILLGTCYPLIIEVITGINISVGAPYFNSIFIPITALICLLMGLAPLLRWQSHSPKQLRVPLALLLINLVMATITTNLAKETFDLWLLTGLFSSYWIVSTTVLCIIMRSANIPEHAKTEFSSRVRFYAMCLAHFGVALSVLGATVVSNFEQEHLLRMGPGQGKTLANYSFIYEQTQQVDQKSYTAIQAKIRVVDSDGVFVTYLYPQRQTFKSNAMQMSAAGIHSLLLGDIYVSMGQQLTNNPNLNDNEYLIRISYKPMVNGIWLGALLMMLSGLTLVLSKRKQDIKVSSQVQLASGATR